MASKRFFLIHGWGGLPHEGWRPWFIEQLQKEGHEVTALPMPNTYHPQCSEWVNYLRECVGTPDADCFFVGHSLGCITILRYLETLKKEESIGGVVCVAGFFEDLGKGYEEIFGFVERPVDWEAVHQHCKKFAVVHSDDDAVVPLLFAKHLAEHLGCDVQCTTGKRHFGLKDNTVQVPEVLHAIESLL
jgi:predicted alpha/beta hydrolase family esterase